MQKATENRRDVSIVLGVTGSIAAYKAVEIASRLVKLGVDTHVIMTANAMRFVQPLSFQTVSRNQVTTSLWDVSDWEPQHISLAQRVSILVVAPASANLIAKMAHGIADDALSSFALSHKGPVIVCPAMNPAMWAHPAMRDNIRILTDRGVRIVGPEPGRAACGDDSGPGRMSEPETIVEALLATLYIDMPEPLARQCGRKLVVSAGPTREMLDPVRFISNRSSGKMGYAVAAAAVAAGYETVLVSGPTALIPPAGVRCVEVVSAAEMAEVIKNEFTDADLLIMAAAVADHRPSRYLEQKQKKEDGESGLLELERTEDIVESVAALRTERQTVVGFAAETENLEENAFNKMKCKNLDWIIANDVSQSDIGFQSDHNQIAVISPDGGVLKLPRMSKIETAAAIIRLFAQE